MLNLYNDNALTLSYIDSLSSGIFPTSLMGLYQAAPCIGPKLNEELTVKNCNGYRNVFTCSIEVREPTAIQTVRQMIPVHYNSISLKGETESQLFVKTQTGSRVQLLDCDIDLHDTQDVSICELLPWSVSCEHAVSSMSKKDIWKNCNFTRHDKFATGVITADGSVLIQGTDIKTKTRRGTDTRLLSSESPIIVYTSAEIVVEEKGESYVFAGFENFTTDEVILSALDKNDIKDMENAYFWQTFWENMDTSDYIDIALILLEIILMPLTIAGFVLACKSPDRERQRKAISKKDIFTYNHHMLKNRRSSPNRR
jgi:hypothetical protein